MSDGGYLIKDKNDNITSVSVLNGMRSIPTIYSNKNATGLNSVLKFGYTHRYQEKNHYKTVVKPIQKINQNSRKKLLFSPVHTVRLSFYDNNPSSFLNSKMLTPERNNKKRALSINSAKFSVLKEDRDKKLHYTPNQIKEIKLIHSKHLRLKSSKV